MSLHLDARDAVYKLTTTLQERLVTQPQRSSVCVRRLRGFCSLHPRMCVRVLPPQHGNALERRSAGSTHLMRLNATRTWLTTTALKVSAQLLESMRNGPGKWKQIFAATPAGSTTQVFLGPDKSLKVQALEVTTKRFSAILAAEIGAAWAEGLYTMRSEGLVFFNWEPLAKVEVEEGGKVTVGWNPAVADLLRLNQANIVKALSAEAKAAAEAGKGAAALRARVAHARWQL